MDMSRPSRTTLRVALGILLVLAPFYVDALHLEEPNRYRYDAARVTYGENGLDYPAMADTIDGVACLKGFSRACNLEMAVKERGNLTVDDVDAGPAWAYRWKPYEYAYLDDTFYRTVTVEDGEGAVLSLERVSAVEAMADIAEPLTVMSPEIRRAVETGSVKTRHQLDDANTLVRTADGDYYVVYRAITHRSSRSDHIDRTFDDVIALGGVGAGLLILRATWRSLP